MYNQHFRYGDKVKMINTSSEELDNKFGTIVGIAVENIVSIYIVEVDNFPNEKIKWKCIALTESCLEHIK